MQLEVGVARHGVQRQNETGFQRALDALLSLEFILREQWRSKKGLKAHVISCIWALKSLWLGKINSRRGQTGGSYVSQLGERCYWLPLDFPMLVESSKLIQKMEVELTAPKYWMDWKGGGGGKQDFQVLGLCNWVEGSTSTEVMKRRRRMGWGQDRQCWGGYRKRLHMCNLIHLNLRYKQGGSSM